MGTKESIQKQIPSTVIPVPYLPYWGYEDLLLRKGTTPVVSSLRAFAPTTRDSEANSSIPPKVLPRIHSYHVESTNIYKNGIDVSSAS